MAIHVNKIITTKQQYNHTGVTMQQFMPQFLAEPLTTFREALSFLGTLVIYRVIEKMDGIWNRYNLKSTGRIYTFGILKCSEKFKVLDLT